MLNIREYVKVQSLEEAYELNQKRTNKVIGGMLWMKMGSRNIQKAIDLSGLGLDKVEETEEEFRIGCMTTLRDLELHPGLEAYTGGAMKESLRHIVGVQFRNLATVGGSIFGRFGFSDVLTLFLGLDTDVELYKGGIVSMADFVSMKMDNDILIRVIVKKRACQIAYMAVRNQSTDFPVLTCCVSKLEGKYRAVIGARPKRAKLVSDENGIMANGVTKEVAAAFASYVAEQVPTDSNLRGSSTYRTHLIHVLTERCVAQLENQQ